MDWFAWKRHGPCARNTRAQEDKAVLEVQYVQRLLWFPDVSI
jgi:hypothetical protein